MRRWLANAFIKAATVLQLVPTFMGQAVWRLGIAFLTLVNEGYKRNAVAYACIRLLAQSVPEPPLKVYRDEAGDEKEQPDHPLRALIKKPNPYMTEFELWELVSTYLSMCGRAPFWKERNRMGEPIGLWPLRPDRIAPILGSQAGQQLLMGWQYVIAGAPFTLPPGDVLMFNFPDPGDDTGGIIGGLGPMQVLAREIDTDSEATSFVFALLSNYAMPGVLLKVKTKLTKDSAEELKAKFIAKYGNMRRGEPAVIDNDADVATMSHNMRDLEFPDLRSISESRIAAGFGVPAILVGLKIGLDRSTFANMSEAREFFAETTLSVLWRRLSDQITFDLLPEFQGSEGLVTRFDTSGVRALQAQIAERAKRFLEGVKAGAVTVNEYRQRALSLPALPTGDVFLRLTTMTAVPIDEDPAATDQRILARRPQVPALPAAQSTPGKPTAAPGEAAPTKAAALGEDRQFGSTQVNLGEGLASAVFSFQQTIDADDLATGGMETQPHITVRFGLDPSVTPLDVARALSGYGPVSVRFGGLDSFPAGDDGVPLFASVTSADLQALHDVLTERLPNTETFPTYTPHVTVAYIKTDAVERYAGKDGPLSGRTAVFSSIVHSGADHVQTTIFLSGAGKAATLDQLGAPLVLSTADMEAAAAPTPEDITAARALWERTAPAKLTGLLNGHAKD